MSEFLKCYRSGNTLRISILARLRYQLNARAGDTLRAETTKEGTVTLTNVSHDERIKMLGRKK